MNALAMALTFKRTRRPKQEKINRLMMLTGWSEDKAISWLTRPIFKRAG